MEKLASFVNASNIEEGDEASGELDHHKMYRTADKRGHEQEEQNVGHQGEAIVEETSKEHGQEHKRDHEGVQKRDGGRPQGGDGGAGDDEHVQVQARTVRKDLRVVLV